MTNAGDYIYMVVNGACKHGDMAHFKEQMADFKGDVHMDYLETHQLLALQGKGAPAALQVCVCACARNIFGRGGRQPRAAAAMFLRPYIRTYTEAVYARVGRSPLEHETRVLPHICGPRSRICWDGMEACHTNSRSPHLGLKEMQA